MNNDTPTVEGLMNLVDEYGDYGCARSDVEEYATRLAEGARASARPTHLRSDWPRVQAEAWLLDLMGEFDFGIPTAAFDRIVDKFRASEARASVEELKRLADGIEAAWDPGAYLCPGYDFYKAVRLLREFATREPQAAAPAPAEPVAVTVRVALDPESGEWLAADHVAAPAVEREAPLMVNWLAEDETGASASVAGLMGASPAGSGFPLQPPAAASAAIPGAGCPICGGTGIDGDVGPRGEVVDIDCSCRTSGELETVMWFADEFARAVRIYWGTAQQDAMTQAARDKLESAVHSYAAARWMEARSTETEGLGPEGAEPGPEGSRPEEARQEVTPLVREALQEGDKA